MSLLPKLPDDDDNLSSDDLSHPQFHTQHESIASVDEVNESSDDEINNQQDENTDGYCLLPQEFNMNQEEDEEEEEEEEKNEDDEFLRFATLRILSSTDDAKTDQTIDPVESLWTSKLESESFPVDDDKADYIKNVMSSIKLPESSVPVWAQYCSEKDWQEILKERIACRQTTLFSDDNK